MPRSTEFLARSAVLASFLTVGTRSAPAWADAPLGIVSSPDGGSAAASPASAVNKPKLIPAALLLQTKLSTNDDPHLPDSVKARHVCSSVTGIYKVCVATTGEVDAVESIAGINGADADITLALRRWRFKPRPSAVCALQTFDFDISGKGTLCDEPGYMPRLWLAARKLSGERPAWPSSPAPSSPLENQTTAYSLCVNKEGIVTTVTPVRGASSRDSLVIKTLQRWRYSPLSFPVCTIEYFRFPRDDSDEPAATLSPTLAKEELRLLRSQRMRNDDPHLPEQVKARNRGNVLVGSYQVCIATDGSIRDVDVLSSIRGADANIVATLLTWRYKPQPSPVCFSQFFEFVVQ